MRALGVALLLTHLGVGQAVAEIGPNPYEDEKPIVDAETEALAVEHFDRGVQFFENGTFDAALAEFEASYALNPNWAILYNIGVCYHRLGRFDDALELLARYLDEGGAWIYPERKKFVTDLVEQMKASCGHVIFEGAAAGVVVTIDSKKTLVTPVEEPVLLTSGMHVITFQSEGSYLTSLEITVAVGETVEVPVILDPLPSTGKWLEIEKRKGLARGLGISSAVFLGVAGLSLVAAAVTGGIAMVVESDRHDALIDCWPNTDSDSCPRASDLHDRGRALTWTTHGLLMGAGAMALTGLVLWLVLRFRVMDDVLGSVSHVALGPLGGRGSMGILLGLSM